jgi:Fe-S protein assembly chaperone HscA
VTDATRPLAPIVGIDLGTTNSLAAVTGRHGALVLRDQDGEPLIPSVVTFRNDGTVVVGRAAKALALDLPDRTVYSVKRLIGRSGLELQAETARLPYRVETGERGLPRIVIDGRRYSPEEVSARVLAEVARTAERALGMPVRDAVVTVPAYFDDAQRQATKDAAELAGLNCVRILNEPTAACLAYGIDGKKDGTVLVYDLGGGTFDVSILKVQACVFRVLATAGDTHLGGDDFDHLLVERILAQLGARAPAGGPLPPYVRQAVRRAAEGLKIQLSEREAAELEIDLGAHGRAALRVTRAEFEALIAPLVERTMQWVADAVRDAGLTFAQLDHVVLVGGSTRIPLVRRRLAEVTGRAPSAEVNPDLAVALGAAVQASVLEGAQRSVLLLDVIPLSLGIETLGGVVSKLILRNSTVPASRTEEFSTQVDHQTAVDINIYQGERELVQHCRKLGSFRLRGIPPMPAGLPRIAVTFLVDADGVLRVTAREQRTGVQASIQVVPSFGLTRDEVRRIMTESITHAEEDMQAREAIELRNKAQAIAHGTRRALELAQLPPAETFSIRKSLQRLEAALQSPDLERLRAHVDELSRLTAAVADDVISAAVKRALTGGG